MGTMMKPVQADSITEESMTIQHIDLYYHPWWAFEFHWKPKDKTGVVELDAVTGEMRQGQALASRVSKMMNRDALFDIGADTVGLLVPGGSIAVKVARLAIDAGEVVVSGEMDTSTFYATASALCFTLLGFWWVVVEYKHDELTSSPGSRHFTFLVSLHFILPGIVSLASLLATGPLWRVAFGLAGLTGMLAVIVGMRDIEALPGPVAGSVGRPGSASPSTGC